MWDYDPHLFACEAGMGRSLDVLGAADEAVSCYWTAGREPREPAPPVTGDLTVDVAVIGGGYTGLSSAYHLKRADAVLDVAVLEAETAGFGASSRNAGFVMTLFGSSAALMKMLHGGARVREAHQFMVRAIDELERIIGDNAIDCDYERAGFLRVATTPAYASRIRKDLELFQSLGIDGLEWVDRDWVAARVCSPRFLGACWEPGCGSLHPAKWLDGLERLARSAGARLYEGTPVTRVEREAGRYRLATPRGTVSAEKVVYATNGYTHLIPGMRSKQAPAFAYIVVTEPLTPEQRAAIGWSGRETIEDGRNFMHFYRLLRDGRVLMGGGPGLVPFGRNMDHDASPRAWEHLERFIGETFPALRGVRVAHRWGGAFSVTADMTPQIGTLDGGGAVYSVGCTGHGVALAQMNGQVIRDLVLGRKTDLTDLWFVNRRPWPMPPEPIRSAVARTVTTAMALDDWWCDRATARR
jgi:glycine/D-amino acid oxidase-like deaminating enzyme